MPTFIGVIDKKGRNAVRIAASMLDAIEVSIPKSYGIAWQNTVKYAQTLTKLQNEKTNSSIAIACLNQASQPDNDQPFAIDHRAIIFDGELYCQKRKLPNLTQNLKTTGKQYTVSSENLIRNSNCECAFIIMNLTSLIIGRDSIGMRPLYYGETDECLAFASMKKPLWNIGVQTVKSFPPGYLATAENNRINFQEVRKIKPTCTRRISLKAASETLKTLLEKSVKDRVERSTKVAIAFSGGLDSSAIAFLAKKTAKNIRLFHVSLPNKPETLNALEVAEKLELPLETCFFTEQDMEAILHKVVQLVEESDPVKIGIAICLYLTVAKVAEKRFDMLLGGQGADELFGGYKRYQEKYINEGSRKARNAILNDIMRLSEANIDRDVKICRFFGIELRLPFATYDIARLAMTFPLDLTVGKEKTSPRKLVLRETSRCLGLPPQVTERPKKAVQYATGVQKALSTIAEREGVNVRQYLQQVFTSVFEKES